MAQTAETDVNLACLEVGGRTYGIDVSQVREIVRMLEITPLPKAPTLIEGVVDLRGTTVPVIDLGRALGGQPIEAGRDARIAVLEVCGLLVGLCVEAATHVLAVGIGALEAPPALATQAGYETVRAVVQRAGATPVMVLSTDHLIESVYRSALSPAGERPMQTLSVSGGEG